MTLSDADHYFFRSLGAAMLALAGSALVLAVAFVTYPAGFPAQENAAESQAISGRQFQTIMGTTRFEGDALVLEGLATEGALVSHTIELKAESHPHLRYRFEGLQPGLQVKFFWRTATTGAEMFAASLPGNGDRAATANLAAQPGWRGTITDIALYVTGDLRGQDLVIPGISLDPYTWQGMLAAVFCEWTGFRGWTPASINALAGTPDAPLAETLSPTVAAAAWAGLALVFLLGSGVLVGRKYPISYGAVILIPWMAVDQLWQFELGTQLQETRLVFGGKTTHQKHLADLDGQIYSYAKRLKDHVLPPSPARVFILHDSWDHNLFRLKTQYYLLPHNIYNFGLTPPVGRVQPGDFILVLGSVPDLRFDANSQQLEWTGQSLPVKALDNDPLGSLFRVVPIAGVPPRPGNQPGYPNG
ncbi:MAG: hypothetical protein ACRCVD_03430 [Halioglobus sp.]